MVSQFRKPVESGTIASDSTAVLLFGDALMMRHLTTLVLAGVLGTFLLSGNAEACHKKTCRHAAPVSCAPTPVVCAPLRSFIVPRPPPPLAQAREDGLCAQGQEVRWRPLRRTSPQEDRHHGRLCDAGELHGGLWDAGLLCRARQLRLGGAFRPVYGLTPRILPALTRPPFLPQVAGSRASSITVRGGPIPQGRFGPIGWEANATTPIGPTPIP